MDLRLGHWLQSHAAPAIIYFRHEHSAGIEFLGGAISVPLRGIAPFARPTHVCDQFLALRPSRQDN